MANSVEQAQSYAIFAVLAVISIPTTCYISYQLQQNWNEEWLMRRRRVLILIICILLFYSILIEFPSYAISRFLDLPLYDLIMVPINYVVRFWLFSFFVLRIYLLYYDHEYNRTLCKNKWKILINPRDLPRQQTWFLENRHRKYGDEEWIISHILVPLTSIYSILFIAGRIIIPIAKGTVYDVYSSFYYLWDLSWTLLWVIASVFVAVFFWKKYPKFADTWMIRKEISILLLLLFIGLWISPVFVMITLISNVSVTQIGVMLLSFSFCVVLFIMVIYPQSAYIRKRKALKEKITESQQLQISWESLVDTKDGYASFMNFLGKELSTENLLFITEYVQLKVAMMNKEPLRHRINDVKLEYHLRLPDKLPISAIVSEFIERINVIDVQDEKQADGVCWEAMNKIYEKYIHTEVADLEVNISSRCRRSITRVYENQSKQKSIEHILVPMEKCVTEISTLLNDSRSRFVEETVFSELAYQISKSNSDKSPIQSAESLQ